MAQVQWLTGDLQELLGSPVVEPVIDEHCRGVPAAPLRRYVAFLGFAAEHKLAVTVHPYPLDAADRALRDLGAGRFDGAAVLIP